MKVLQANQMKREEALTKFGCSFDAVLMLFGHHLQITSYLRKSNFYYYVFVYQTFYSKTKITRSGDLGWCFH